MVTLGIKILILFLAQFIGMDTNIPFLLKLTILLHPKIVIPMDIMIV